MDRKTKICIWVIMIGLANFLIYTLVYTLIGGEAANGHLNKLIATGEIRYVLNSGHQVSSAVYIYSGVHSISIWLTVSAIMLAMLTLAKDRIVSAMHSAVVRGRTFITILATVIALITIVATILFTLQFVRSFANPHLVPPGVVQVTSQA